jgi:hypothetical protein
VAAAGLATYGVSVMLSAVFQLNQLGWENVDAQQFRAPLTRFVGMNVIAWGLSRRARWAWWAALLFAGFILSTVVGAFVVYLIRFPDTPRMSPASFILVIGLFVLLLVPFILLLTPAGRRPFKRSAV